MDNLTLLKDRLDSKISAAYRRAETLINRPRNDIAVTASLTRVCNARCPMCPMHNMENNQWQHMDDKTFHRMVEIFKQLHNRYLALHSMGECLAHPDLKRYIDILRDNHFWIRVSTNASLLHRHMDTMLRVQYLRYSIEGWDEASLKKYRNLKFDQVYDNIKEFWHFSRGKVSYPIRLAVSFYPSMTEDNIREFTEVWGPYVDQISVSMAYNPQLNHTQRFRAPIPKDKFGDYYYMEPKQGPLTCGYAMGYADIQPNGDVLPCCDDYAGQLTLGNIHEEDFMAIFNGERARNLRAEFEQGNPVSCGNCHTFYDFTDEAKQHLEVLRGIVVSTHDKVRRNRAA
ncbi:MAG: SPASM domain-containing protein [Hyphomicrobiales bacterium]|nr:SPASM domain-containing protein [Hyphomicrobiales bacterium]MCP5370545.1 SPASM domain-containing protein [Hyphomicrobiales bacterium]